jgi:hypothetical protein
LHGGKAIGTGLSRSGGGVNDGGQQEHISQEICHCSEKVVVKNFVRIRFLEKQSSAFQTLFFKKSTCCFEADLIFKTRLTAISQDSLPPMCEHRRFRGEKPF